MIIWNMYILKWGVLEGRGNGEVMCPQDQKKWPK